MPRIVSSVGLPAVQLTAEDEIRLRTVTGVVESEIVAHYEDFLVRCKRQVDKTQWRLLRTDADLSVFQERGAKLDDMGFMSSAPATATVPGPHASMVKESSVARILVVGTLAGSLDDAMYASSFQDTPSLRIHEAYQRDFLDDSAVLGKIEGPTSVDPYNFLGVTWHLRSFKVLGIVGKTTDCLLVQSIHLSRLSSGERIGVSIRHSIEHRDLPELNDFSTQRIMMSSATIYRQVDLAHVEVYSVEFIDAKGNIARDVVGSLTSACTNGFKKKLHWLMKQSHRRRKLETDKAPPVVEREIRDCELCNRSTSGLFSASGSGCQLCFKHACSRCTVTHDIVIDGSNTRVVTKPFRLCVECVLHTKAAKTFDVAMDEANGCAGDSIAILGSASTASRSSSEK